MCSCLRDFLFFRVGRGEKCSRTGRGTWQASGPLVSLIYVSLVYGPCVKQIDGAPARIIISPAALIYALRLNSTCLIPYSQSNFEMKTPLPRVPAKT